MASYTQSRGSIELGCRNCGRPINVQKKHLLSGRGLYCSRVCFHPATRAGWKDRMWALIDRSAGPNECWPWLGAFFSRGYPRHAVDGKMHRVNRLIAITCLGPIPKNWLACHECDNPVCCNPMHLFIGTHLANSKDRDKKGRTDRKIGALRDRNGKFLKPPHQGIAA